MFSPLHCCIIFPVPSYPVFERRTHCNFGTSPSHLSYISIRRYDLIFMAPPGIGKSRVLTPLVFPLVWDKRRYRSPLSRIHVNIFQACVYSRWPSFVRNLTSKRAQVISSSLHLIARHKYVDRQAMNQTLKQDTQGSSDESYITNRGSTLDNISHSK